MAAAIVVCVAVLVGAVTWSTRTIVGAVEELHTAFESDERLRADLDEARADLDEACVERDNLRDVLEGAERERVAAIRERDHERTAHATTRRALEVSMRRAVRATEQRDEALAEAAAWRTAYGRGQAPASIERAVVHHVEGE